MIKKFIARYMSFHSAIRNILSNLLNFNPGLCPPLQTQPLFEVHKSGFVEGSPLVAKVVNGHVTFCVAPQPAVEIGTDVGSRMPESELWV